jgi:putative transposase
MKTKKYSDSQIAAILKQGADGIPVPELCRTYGMSSASYYKWRSQYSGMEASHMKQLRELQSENARLKKLYAEAQLHADILKEAMAKK